jgi:hypothetical protein
VAVGSVGVFRNATFALKYWPDLSLKFVQYLHTQFQCLSAAILQLNIGKPLEINAYQSKISVQRDSRRSKISKEL